MLPSSWAGHPARWSRAIEGTDLAHMLRLASKSFGRFRSYMGESVDTGPTFSESPRWLRPKGNITHAQLSLLLLIAVAPLVIAAIRISAFPGVLTPGMSGSLLPSLGHDLNELLSLHRVPSAHRSRILYLLFLPTGAMLIALARLTFGLRVIGFRSILISVGFQQSGVVPGMLLIAVMVVVVGGVRPALIGMRLPYYARVSVIMSISVLVLLTILVIAPWMRSDVLWRLGFFPVIVLGLLAEGIAKTLDRDSGLTAIWRTGMTIGIALLLAGLAQLPVRREIAIQFPELVLTQLVVVILISEFLDLRLLQDWDARLSGEAMSRLFSKGTALRVAVVRNRRKNGVIAPMGAVSRGGYSRRSVRRIVGCLRESGHTVKVVEGDMRLLSKLRDFIPPHPRTGQPGGIVLDLSHGIQGDLAAAHVPAMLEMSGVAYIGPALHGHLVALDKILATTLLERAGIPTPDRRVASTPSESLHGLRYPQVVKPRFATHYKLRLARDRKQLEEAIRMVLRRDREAVVEPYVSGREIQVALIGNDPVECLPLVEVGSQEKACPAAVDAELARRIREAAVAAFEACGCRDFAVVNLRVSGSGRLQVVEIGETDGLEIGGTLELAGEAAGLGFRELLERIIDVARNRWAAAVALPEREIVSRSTGVVRGSGRTVVAS